MKRIDITPINYRWHGILKKKKHRIMFENDDPFFETQEDVMMRLDRGFGFELGLDVYENAEINPLCPSTF